MPAPGPMVPRRIPRWRRPSLCHPDEQTPARDLVTSRGHVSPPEWRVPHAAIVSPGQLLGLWAFGGPEGPNPAILSPNVTREPQLRPSPPTPTVHPPGLGGRGGR